MEFSTSPTRIGMRHDQSCMPPLSTASRRQLLSRLQAGRRPPLRLIAQGLRLGWIPTPCLLIPAVKSRMRPAYLREAIAPLIMALFAANKFWPLFGDDLFLRSIATGEFHGGTRRARSSLPDPRIGTYDPQEQNVLGATLEMHRQFVACNKRRRPKFHSGTLIYQGDPSARLAPASIVRDFDGDARQKGSIH